MENLECNNRIISDDKTMTTKELECPPPIPPQPPSLNIKNESIKGLVEDKVEKCDITPENLTKFDRSIVELQQPNPIVGRLLVEPCFGAVVMETKMTVEDPNKKLASRAKEMWLNNNENNDQSTHTTNSIKNVQSSAIPKSVSAFELKSSETDANKSTKNELKIEEDDDEKPRPSPLAFTIDFGDGGRPVDNEKYKNMVEKFQNRHRRGQSLSKIEDKKSIGGPTASNVMTSSGGGLGSLTASNGAKVIRPPMSAKLPRRNVKPIALGANSESSFSSEQEDNQVTSNVKLRDRNRQNVEQSKRHSWSPRTSGIFNEPPKNVTSTRIQPPQPPPDDKPVKRTNQPTTKFTPQSSTLAQVLDVNYKRTPSKVVDVVCVAPPLEHVVNSDDESVSEAGTYTLDSDQYTEEQKEKMSIDKLAQQRQEQLFIQSKMASDSLEIIDLDEDPPSVVRPTTMTIATGRKNVLEISVFHNEPTSVVPAKPKTSYLEKIKSRVKTVGLRGRGNQSDKINPPETETDNDLPSPDVGCFTSVTTSGVLSVKPNLEPNPSAKLTRRNSLTKSQLDASEYVAGRSRLNLKTGYPKQQQKSACDNEFYVNDVDIEEKLLNVIPHPSSSSSNDLGGGVNLSETIKTAATKNDWITEWAKYAREYAQKSPPSKASSQPPPGVLPTTATNVHHHQQQSSPSRRGVNSGYCGGSGGNSAAMTRSYEFENYRTKHENNNFDCDEDYSVMTKSSDYSNYDDEFGDNLDRKNGRPKVLSRHQIPPTMHRGQRGTFHPSSPSYEYSDGNENFNFQHRNSMRRGSHGNYYPERDEPSTGAMISTAHRPPMSPSKIPSPIHSISRARGPAARNRSRNGSNTDLNIIPNDTEMYLQNTAAAIATLQNIHRHNSLHNSPQTPSSPVQKFSPKLSPYHHSHRSPMSPVAANLPSPVAIVDNDEFLILYKKLHHRNLSLDGSEMKPKVNNVNNYTNAMSNSYNTDGLNIILDMNKTHTRHHSYDGMPNKKYIDQTNVNYDNHHSGHQTQQQQNHLSMRHQSPAAVATKPTNKTAGKSMLPSSSSPIRRSSSFSVKHTQQQPAHVQHYPGPDIYQHFNYQKFNKTRPQSSQQQQNPSTIRKSASSTSFRKMMIGHAIMDPNNDDVDELEFYINNDDDLNDDDYHRIQQGDSTPSEEFSDEGEGLELKEPITNTRYNKAFLMRMEQNKKPTNSGGVGGSGSGLLNKKQGVVACPNTPEMRRRDPASGRLSLRERQSMPRDSSLSRMKQEMPALNTTKKTLTSAGSKEKIMPKYMDISKYKQPATGNFLKKDESKSYLQHKEVRRSPSSASMNLSRNDQSRASNRSIKSAGAKSAVITKKEQIAQKAKEAELAMWKRRASYDPMKAAAEDRKRREEAKRQQQQSKLGESSVVLRSQSFHSGVTGNQQNIRLSNNGANNPNDVRSNRWTLTSTESSDEED